MDERAVFVAVVDAGSFTTAAERLGISTSYASRRIRALEERLGTPLLTRTTRMVTPTEAGLRYHARVAPMLQGLADADAEVREVRAIPTGTLRVAAPLSFGLSHVVPVLVAFQARWPEVRLETSLRDQRVDPLLWDVTIRGGKLEDTTLVARKLVSTCSRVAASPAYLDAAGRPSHPSELTRHRLLEYSVTGVAQWSFQRDGEPVHVQCEPRMRADSGDALVAAAVAGLGVVNQPEFLVQPALEAGTLEAILDDWSSFAIDFWAITPTRHPTAATRELITMLRESLGGP
ncbi:MAG: LysR family transcriptional regulator [Myxococcota bacterium]